MTENLNDKLSIKNILFTRARANYIPAVPNDGHKFFCCTDCGDRFIFESSFRHHVNRKSLKITYMCRHCNQVHCFLNRCNLLSHIRSHAFRTATINVSDLKIEPLPLSEYKVPVVVPPQVTTPSSQGPLPVIINAEKTKPSNFNSNLFTCMECNRNIPGSGNQGLAYRERALHYAQQSNETHSCPVCMYTLPNKCALKAHIRIHLKLIPLYCTDCGLLMSKKSVTYPYSHFCEGFRMMRAAARLKCPMDGCTIFHPSEYSEHIKTHIKKVYKCPSCLVACFNKDAVEKHFNKHAGNHKAIVFFQCLMCPGRLVMQHQLKSHLKSHQTDNFVYLCWTCDLIFKTPKEVVEHSLNNTCAKTTTINNVNKVAGPSEMGGLIGNDNANVSFRVVKRCDKCERAFTYTCKYNEIDALPGECPFGCVLGENPLKVSETYDASENTDTIVCNLCGNRTPQDWTAVKKHFAESHKDHKCVDLEIKLSRIRETAITTCNDAEGTAAKQRKIEEGGRKSTTSRKSTVCMKCNKQFDTIARLQEHLITHRDPCTAYQCFECGECYVVKPSFSKHLLLEHGIDNVDDYVKNKKQCYNEDALSRYQIVSENTEITEPIKENQCYICREQFQNHDDLDKHFRGHGMAFLIKNTQKKKSP